MAQECHNTDCKFHAKDEPLCYESECKNKLGLSKFLAPPLSFTEWSENNSQELDCIFAETGADREYGFNRDDDEETIYNRNDFNEYPALVW
jgi:hypothetical protein